MDVREKGTTKETTIRGLSGCPPERPLGRLQNICPNPDPFAGTAAFQSLVISHCGNTSQRISAVRTQIEKTLASHRVSQFPCWEVGSIAVRIDLNFPCGDFHKPTKLNERKNKEIWFAKRQAVPRIVWFGTSHFRVTTHHAHIAWYGPLRPQPQFQKQE